MAINNDLSSGSFDYNVSASPMSNEITNAKSIFDPTDNSVGGTFVNALTRLILPRTTSSAENRYNAAKAAEISEWQANRNRQWQEYMFNRSIDYNTKMSNTAYQRAVSDLKKAGLNPILAYNSGASSTPTVSAPSGSTGSSFRASDIHSDGLITSLLKLVAGSLSIAKILF